MKRGYFILIFLLLVAPMFYSETRAADDDIVVIVPGGNSVTVSGAAHAQCTDGVDNENFASGGIDIPSLSGSGSARHTGQNARGKIDCADPVCSEYFNAFGAACPSSDGGATDGERPRKCTGNVLEYADGGTGGITMIRECAFGCVDEGNGVAYCEDAPEVTPPTVNTGGSTGGGCTRESDEPSQDEDNQCDLTKSAEFALEDNLQFQVNDGVPKLYSAQMISQLPIEKIASSGSCEYYYFPYTHEDYHGTKEFTFLRTEEMPGLRACYFDSSSLESLRGLVGEGADFPSEVVVYIETDEASAGGRYIEDEKIINTGTCGTSYEIAGSFGDSTSTLMTHCVKYSDEFVSGRSYVTNSYLEKYDGVRQCRGGGTGLLWFSSKGDVVYFCVEKKVPSSESDVLRESKFSEGSCPRGTMSGEDKFATYGSVSVQHCVDSVNANVDATDRDAVESVSTFGAATICPDVLVGDVAIASEDCALGGKLSCEVDISSGRTEYFGFVLDKKECVVSEDNGGAAVSGDIEDRAEAVVANCDTSAPDVSGPVCGNGKMDEGEECETDRGAVLVGEERYSGENSCQVYDSDYYSGTLVCDSECKLDVGGCVENACAINELQAKTLRGTGGACCGDGKMEGDEECDQGQTNGIGKDGWCTKECKAVLPSYCTNSKNQPFGAIVYPECLAYKNRFEKLKISPKDKDYLYQCTNVDVNPDKKRSISLLTCHYYGSVVNDLNDPWEDYNSAWGLCSGNICRFDKDMVFPQGTWCECICGSEKIGLGEYCESEGAVCAKNSGRLEANKGNRCELQPNGKCMQGVQEDLGRVGDRVYGDIVKAQKDCESQGKIFVGSYKLGLASLKSTACWCVPREAGL